MILSSFTLDFHWLLWLTRKKKQKKGEKIFAFYILRASHSAHQALGGGYYICLIYYGDLWFLFALNVEILPEFVKPIIDIPEQGSPDITCILGLCLRDGRYKDQLCRSVV